MSANIQFRVWRRDSASERREVKPVAWRILLRFLRSVAREGRGVDVFLLRLVS